MNDRFIMMFNRKVQSLHFCIFQVGSYAILKKLLFFISTTLEDLRRHIENKVVW